MRSHACIACLIVAGLASLSWSTRDIQTGKVTGKLTQKGSGVSGMIAFFNDQTGPPPRPDRYFRIPDSTVYTDRHGSFSISLPAGGYFVSAIVRKSGREHLGPPLEGDVMYLPRDDSGRDKLWTVKKGASVDIGTLGDTNIVTPTSSPETVYTRIEGKVVSRDTRPVAGVFVVAYPKTIADSKPLFVSERTGTDGRYSLGVSSGGQFFLRARTRFGPGPPKFGNLIGVYGGEQPLAVPVRTGQTVRGKDITAVAFTGQGPSTHAVSE